MYPPPPYTNNAFQEQPYPAGFINQPPPPPYCPPPGPLPAQPQAHPIMINTSQYVVAMPQPVYRDYMALSIFTMIVFCLPAGILALVNSSKSREALQRGDPLLAARFSANALRLNIVGIVIGACGHIAWIAYVIYSTCYRSYTYTWHG